MLFIIIDDVVFKLVALGTKHLLTGK